MTMTNSGLAQAGISPSRASSPRSSEFRPCSQQEVQPRQMTGSRVHQACAAIHTEALCLQGQLPSPWGHRAPRHPVTGRGPSQEEAARADQGARLPRGTRRAAASTREGARLWDTCMRSRALWAEAKQDRSTETLSVKEARPRHSPAAPPLCRPKHPRLGS